MPQPLSKVRRNATVGLNNVGDGLFCRHPSFPPLIVEALRSWSHAESFMMQIFIELLGGPKETAALVFLSINQRSARAAAIDAMASATLPLRANRLLKSIMRKAKSNAAARDLIAHGVWGDSAQIPDVVLLTHFSTTLDKPYDHSRIMVYKENDFEIIINNNKDLVRMLMSFSFILMKHPANRDDRLYAELEKELKMDKT
ncbi:hypothetical protein GC209_19295 [bacterium]|nr:hypothetical protein [bacterium]